MPSTPLIHHCPFCLYLVQCLQIEVVRVKMTLVDTKLKVKYRRRRCQHGKDSQSDLYEGASRGSSENLPCKEDFKCFQWLLKGI
jgi:hypothetical protein